MVQKVAANSLIAAIQFIAPTNKLLNYTDMNIIRKFYDGMATDGSGGTSVSQTIQEFMDEVDYMMRLYGNQKYSQAEALRDKLAKKLDDIMRLGGDNR